MKTSRAFEKILFLSFFIFISMHVAAQQKVTKIACVGNSITYGAFIADRDKNSYPAQLQVCLGKEYEVQNFGVSGTTLLSDGDYPYISTQEYINSQKFQPDIVLIKLGTNDTKPQNWKHRTEFESNYQTLINSYKALDSHPRIILLTPIRCFLTDESSINAKHIENFIRPMVEEIARKNNLEIIDMSNLFGNQWQAHLMPDKIHPSAIGAGMMAKEIAAYLKRTDK